MLTSSGMREWPGMHDRQPSLAQTADKESVVADLQLCFTKLSAQVAEKLARAKSNDKAALEPKPGG